MVEELTLTLSDVVSAGSIPAAIEAACDDHDSYASGVIGPEFSTSGPGPGWTKKYCVLDFAARALSSKYGACGYVDSADGRLATEFEGEIEWTEDSIICLEVPSPEDAMAHPTEAALMADAAISGLHSDLSDRDAWRDLVRSVRVLASELEEINID